MAQKYYISKKARRRVKELGGSTEDLLLVYMLQVRVHTEQSCAAWNGALTKMDIRELESIQKAAAKIILGWDKYKSYKNALKILQIPTLESRRKELCVSFAKKCLTSTKY